MGYRWIACLFLLTVSAGLPANAQDAAQKWEQVYEAGITALYAGDYVKAEKNLREALTIARKFGDADGRYAESLGDLGAVLFLQQRYDEARPFLEHGLALHKTTIGVHEKTRNAAHWMGEFYLTVGEYDKAAEALLYSLDVGRKAKVPDDSQIIVLYESLGIALVYAGRGAEAVEPLKDVVESQAASPDVTGTHLASSRDWYGSALYSAGRYEEAAKQHQLAIDIWKKTGENANIAYALSRLGNAYNKLGNDRKAEAAYLDELKYCDQVFGENSKESLIALRHQLDFYKPRNKPATVAYIEGRISKITGEPAPGQIPAASRDETPDAVADRNVLAEIVDGGNADNSNSPPDPYDEIPAILYRKANVGSACDATDRPANVSDNEYFASMSMAWAKLALEEEAKNLPAAYELYAEALFIGLKCTNMARDLVPTVMMRIAIVAMHLDRKNEAENTSTFAIQFADIRFNNKPKERREIYELFADLHRALGNEALAKEAEAFAANIGK